MKNLETWTERDGEVDEAGQTVTLNFEWMLDVPK